MRDLEPVGVISEKERPQSPEIVSPLNETMEVAPGK